MEEEHDKALRVLRIARKEVETLEAGRKVYEKAFGGGILFLQPRHRVVENLGEQISQVQLQQKQGKAMQA